MHDVLFLFKVSNACLAHNMPSRRSSLDTAGLSFPWDFARHPENNQMAWRALPTAGTAAAAK